MAYTPIGWLNDQAPAINQTNLNKMDEELVALDKGENDLTTDSFKYLTETNGEISVKSTLNISGGIRYSDGTEHNSASVQGTYYRSLFIPVYKNSIVKYKNFRTAAAIAVVAVYDANKNYIANESVAGINKKDSGFVQISNIGYIRLCCNKETYAEETTTVTILNDLGLTKSKQEEEINLLSKENSLFLSEDSINENVNKYINSGGVIASTASNIGISNKRFCKEGDVITYKISNETGKLFLAVYDYNDSFITGIAGQGGSTILEGTYTFENDGYFRIGGVLARVNNYNVQYDEAPYRIKQINEELGEHEYRITALEEGDIGLIPDYWKTYLDNKLPSLRETEIGLGLKGVEFAFITDIHIPRNSMYSPLLLKYIAENTNLPFIINGGDLIDYDQTKAAAILKFYQWRHLMYGMKEFCVIGNHDLNQLGGVPAEANLTYAEWYRIMLSPVEKDINYGGDSTHIYYTIDDEIQKFRYIILGINLSESGADAQWFARKLTELDSSWTILVISHYMWASTIEDFHAIGERIINIINANYANINANFVGILAGHTHHDNAIKEETYGYNIIATTCDTRSGEYTRTEGTTNEQAFDLIYINTEAKTITMKRIGAGSDRLFTY